MPQAFFYFLVFDNKTSPTGEEGLTMWKIWKFKKSKVKKTESPTGKEKTTMWQFLSKWWIDMTVNAVGITILGLLPIGATWFAGAGSASIMFGLAGTIFWFAFYLAKGLRKVEEKQFRVVERFGKYHWTICEGLTVLCLPGVIDNYAKHGGDNGDFKYHTIEVEDSKDALDFQGGGTGTPKLSIMYRVIDSRGKKEPEIEFDGKKLHPDLRGKDGAYLYVYVVEQSEARIREVIMGSLRPMLQKYTIDKACNELGDISALIRNKDEGVIQALLNMGVALDPHKGVVLSDIKLSDSMVKARDEVVLGKKNAEKQKEQGSGYMNAILAIIEAGKEAKIEISFAEAKSLYEIQRGLETLAQKLGSMNFVAPGINNALVSMNVSDPQQQQKGGK
ncbi:MAG TPA: hypothetical protein P5274_02790 [Candidatus Paceibacterota bacterium]|nr:hypothetical protein [Candidatus Paceibacterota bacterium]